MLGTVALPQRHIADYSEVVGEETFAELRALARPLQGLSVANLSLASFGTWVTDLLSSSVPLLQDLGLEASWYVLRAEQRFETEMRALYAALNGESEPWTPARAQAWEQFSAATRATLGAAADADIVVI